MAIEWRGVMICPKCNKWEVRDEDLFCSWCRLKLSDFELSLDPGQLYVGDPLLEPLTLTIKHTGASGQVHIKQITANQSWVKLLGNNTTDLTLRSGGIITVPVEVDPLEMIDDYHEAVIEAQGNIGSRSVKLHVVPRPEIQVFTGEYTILLDMVQDEKNSGYIEVTRGVVTVKNLTTDVPWATVELCDGVVYPCRLDGKINKRLDFRFVIDEQYLINDIEGNRKQPPVEYQGHLILRYVELTIERKESFRVKCHLPPTVVIPEEVGQTVRADVFLGKRKELDITLQNGDRHVGGRAELKVLEITIDQDWMRPAAPFAYPIAIPSGGYHQIGFVLVADDIGEGIHAAKITLLTNLPSPHQQRDLFVLVSVKRLEDFEGTLAIDFGTTNSCCAYIDEFGRQDLIDIDAYSKPKPTTAPSAVLYWDSADDHSRDFEIGKLAYDYSLHAETKPTTVVQVKRRLGLSEPEQISLYRNAAKQISLLPREVAADILSRILERAEEVLGGRITRCTISHPSRFSLRQVADLKAAIVACGIREGNIVTIHEPVGAALNFIQRLEVVETHQEYSLMVFDFGGGTTDITLMHVVNHYDAEREVYTVRPKVLGANGMNLFGGENVTDIVTDIARRKCYALLTEERHPDAASVVLPLDQTKFEKEQYRGFANANRPALRRWAEASKIALAEFGDDHPREIAGLISRPDSRLDLDVPGMQLALQDGLKLTVIVDGAISEETFIHADVVPYLEELEADLRPKLEELAHMMKDLASQHRISQPDIILLSGKSSAFPLVTRIMEETFPGSAIEKPDDLKECVVIGACSLSSTIPVAGIEIDVAEPMTTTTSRLGIRVNEAGHIKFKGFVDAGVPIPTEGLRGPVRGLGRIRRHNVISILENTSLRDEFVVDGKDNREIRDLTSYRVEHTIDEWERKHQATIGDKDIKQAQIEFEISPTLNVKLLARIPGVDDPIEFEAALD